MSGTLKSGGSKASANNPAKSHGNVYQFGGSIHKSGPHHGGKGGASRYFQTFPPEEESMPEGWECVEGCAVRELGRQSGVSRSKHNEKPSAAPNGNTWGGTIQTNRGARGHSDTGTAARFFMQFGEDNLIEPVQEEASVRIIQGDCVEEMRSMPENSVDSVVCDPPYGLEFMGKEWDRLRPEHPGNPDMKARKAIDKDSSSEPRAPDNPWQKEASGYGSPKKNPRCRKCEKHKRSSSPCVCETPDWDTREREYAQMMQVWHEAWAREALRVLKPGGYLLAFGGTRTVHRLACAIEDAGFEIRDRYLNIGGDATESIPGEIAWVYGSGFPKSANIEKLMTKAQGQKRRAHGMVPLAGPQSAQMHSGIGSSVKPAYEPIVCARKPLSEKNLIQNILKHGEWLEGGTVYLVGTGGLNIDQSRVANTTEAMRNTPGATKMMENRPWAERQAKQGRPILPMYHKEGRFPANLLLSHSPGCQRVGSRKVKNQGGVPKAHTEKNVNPAFTSTHETSTVHHFDPDGTEEVAAFSCVESCPVRALDEQSGVSKSGGKAGKRYQWKEDHGAVAPFASQGDLSGQCISDKGTASRYFSQFHEPGFFYSPKSSKRDRTANGTVENSHPTCKPTTLMRYLIRLVTPSSSLFCANCYNKGNGAHTENVSVVRAGVPAEQSGTDILLSPLSGESERQEASGDTSTQDVPDVPEDVQAEGCRESLLLDALPSGDAEKATAELSDMRNSVSPQIKEREASEVLFAGMRDTSSENDKAPSVRMVRDGMDAEGGRRQEVLLPEVRSEMDGEEEGQRLRNRPEGLQAPVPARSPEVKQAGLHHGAPGSYGGSASPSTNAERGGTSQERDKGRQSPREPGSDASPQTQQPVEAAAEANRVPALQGPDSRFGTCSACGSALSRRGGVVLDPFAGSGTSGVAALSEGFNAILIEAEPEYVEIAERRCAHALRECIEPKKKPKLVEPVKESWEDKRTGPEPDDLTYGEVVEKFATALAKTEEQFKDKLF